MRHILTAALLLWNTPTVADWKWLSDPTPASSPELIALHEQIHAPSLDGVLGVPAGGARWSAELLELHLESGALFSEPTVEGYPIGAFFAGRGTVSFRPESRRNRRELDFWFGTETLESHPFSHALFFTLQGTSVQEQLGLTGTGSVPLENAELYEESKLALRQLGLTPLHAFLNRDGRSKGTTYVLLPVESIRRQGSAHAYLLYSFDPDRPFEIQLLAAGHKELSSAMPHKWFFRTLVRTHSASSRFVPEGRVEEYGIDLSVGIGKYSAREETTIRFSPAPGASALRLGLTPRMEVESVQGPDGKPLPFLQWENLEGDPNYDPNLLVVPGPLDPETRYEIRVKSAGSLFEPWFDTVHWLAEEDTWLAKLDDPGGSLFDLRFAVPKGRIAVSSGELLSEEVRDGQRHYHFRTRKPHKSSTLYFGDFISESAEVDGIDLQVYTARTDVTGSKNLDFALSELGRMIEFYSETFFPLEVDVLRVAGVPTGHGRGFEGIILLGQNAGFASRASRSDLFRAHEVAHQWWGNVVRPREWPNDRWLSEAFAEYSAMEYYRIRFDKPEKTRDQIYRSWVRPLVEAIVLRRTLLTGEKRQEKVSERFPIIAGGSNVYTKGPMVLHMLRYEFQQEHGDAAFWDLLREFLRQNRYREAGTDDFMALAGEKLGRDLTWFRDQWIDGTSIPVIRWKHTTEAAEDGWRVRVEAEQNGTAFRLAIPVFFHLPGNEERSQPLIMDGSSGSIEVLLPEKPRNVTLNDSYQALVEVK